MTYILHHEARSQSNALAAIASSSRLATGFISRMAAELGRVATALPEALSRAFAMAYTGPYQAGRRGKDPSNPENF